ncbi:GspD family T2SS secretin variant XcpQ [Arenicella sp. 4NH20-0111]|uniref:secretin N-terminal domain-containing protein n=1 Tax=Arenicella sp. 4NH20-0111 TaxID=3127648 RepID=UPI0031049C0D
MKKQQINTPSPKQFSDHTNNEQLPTSAPKPSRSLFALVQRKARRNGAMVLLMASMTSLFGINSVNAQTERGNATAENQNEVKLNLQDVDIRVLINTVAEVSGKNFIVDPRVKGKVSVISGKSVSPDELYDYFLAILEVHNFATVGSGNVIKVLPSNVIKQKPTTTLFTPTEQENDEQITQIIQLQHASVQDLVAIIRPLIPPTSHFAPHTPSNSVILTDTAANIQRVLKIIRRIDIPDKRSNTHVVYLEKTKASDMSNSLTQLITSSADPKDAATGAKLSIQPFDAINALVISATDEQFARVKALIDELDVERDLAGDVNVITLKYAKAEDLVSILNDVTASNTQGAATDFNVQADEASNSLIVKASGGQLKTVQSVVEKLDKRRAQVFVETIIAEVSLNQDGRLGVTWDAGVPAPVIGTGDDAVSDNRLNRVGSRSGTGLSETLFSNLATTAGFNYRLFDFGRYQLDVVLNALRSDTNSNVLSTPTILTLDNEEAEIIVGQEVPFVTGVFNNGLNNNGTDGGTGTGSAVGSGFQTIERKDVGIKLKIKPQINEGDTIQLEVFQETSSVANTVVQGQADLITNRRSIEAVVQVDDGQVVALGGLITDDVTDTEEWVPFLGKIPVIGYLFRSKSKNAVKRNLMVFLKPRIVRTPSDLAKYSKSKYNEVRRDGILYANKTDDALVLPSVEAPVLVTYEESLNEGLIGTESRKRGSLKGDPKKSTQRKVKDIIFGRKRSLPTNDVSEDTHPEGEVPVGFTTDGELDSLEEKRVENILEQIEQKERKASGPVLDVSSQKDRAGQ